MNLIWLTALLFIGFYPKLKADCVSGDDEDCQPLSHNAFNYNDPNEQLLLQLGFQSDKYNNEASDDNEDNEDNNDAEKLTEYDGNIDNSLTESESEKSKTSMVKDDEDYDDNDDSGDVSSDNDNNSDKEDPFNNKEFIKRISCYLNKVSDSTQIMSDSVKKLCSNVPQVSTSKACQSLNADCVKSKSNDDKGNIMVRQDYYANMEKPEMHFTHLKVAMEKLKSRSSPQERASVKKQDGQIKHKFSVANRNPIVNQQLERQEGKDGEQQQQQEQQLKQQQEQRQEQQLEQQQEQQPKQQQEQQTVQQLQQPALLIPSARLQIPPLVQLLSHRAAIALNAPILTQHERLIQALNELRLSRAVQAAVAARYRQHQRKCDLYNHVNAFRENLSKLVSNQVAIARRVSGLLADIHDVAAASPLNKMFLK